MIRVRFAPSPTGYLHVGGARTALYNFLFARQNKGRFILRLEDTDISRSTEEAIDEILKSLKWLGLDFDEGEGEDGDFGPYRQSERLKVHKKAVDDLINKGKAYFCFCQTEDLKKKREQALKSGRPPTYDKLCRDLTPEKIKDCKSKGMKPTVRIKAPLTGETVVNDLIKGKISVKNENLDDYIVLRSNGTPTYNLAVVVDDQTMAISHVIRGDDHLSNTFRQLLLYNALGYKPPNFAHLPLIIGEDKKPLSKRHGATSVEEFQEKGYLPEALVNYLALLGWSFDEKTTIFSKDELIEKFSLEKVAKNPAVFDFDKLTWLNGHYIRRLSDKKLAEKCLPFLKKAGLIKEKPADLDKIAGLIKERLKTLADIPELTAFFFKEKITYDAKAKAMFKSANADIILNKTVAVLEEVEPFETENIESALRKIPAELDLKPKEVFQTIRAKVTGKLISPPLFESLEILGKEKTISRLKDKSF